MSKTPLVSLITPCYNAERYIEKLLGSVLSQSYSNVEYIIVNDGSTDGSLHIIEKYRKAFEDRGYRLIVIDSQNGGAASAINKALAVFSGEYITFIDADDFMSKDSIAKRVTFLESAPEYDAVYSATNVVDESDYSTVLYVKSGNGSENLFQSMLMEDGYVWTHAYMVRSSFFLDIHKTRSIAEYGAGQNIQLFLPLWHTARVGYIDEPLVTIVEHDDSHSRTPLSENATLLRTREIEEIYLDTLNRMPMSDHEKEKYTTAVKDRYSARTTRTYSVNVYEDELDGLYAYDEQKFKSGYITDVERADQTQLAAKLVFSSHSLEKSLSNDQFEVGHGLSTARLLVDLLRIYKNKKYDAAHLSYISTLSTLKSFYERHVGTIYEQDIREIFGTLFDDILRCESTIGGATVIKAADKQCNEQKNFRELAHDRYSVRSYVDEPISSSTIEEVVEIAMKTPTVCNRQSLKVHLMQDKKVIAEVLKVQGGIDHYETPPNLFLITADDRGYVGINERNQGFIDGGLFAMSVLYALEFKGLAACPLNAMFTEIPEKKIRGMLGLPDSEKLITFISFGYFKEENNVCKSFRYPASAIISEKKSLQKYTIQQQSSEHGDDHAFDTPPLAQSLRAAIRLRTRLRNAKDMIARKVRVRTRIKEAQKSSEKSKRLQREAAEYDGAIVTLPGNYNYGNLMQKYALQSFLKSKNYKVRIIDTIRINDDSNPQIYGKMKHFFDTKLDSMPYEQVKDAKYKNYIVGSDQVWRNWYGNEPHLFYNYFVDFATGSASKKIAYAASFGVDSLIEAGFTQEVTPVVRGLIKDFDAISVRESSGVGLVHELRGDNSPVETVVDPTLLLTAPVYSELVDESEEKNTPVPALYGYVLDKNGKKGALIQKIADSYDSNYRIITPNDSRSHESVELWLKGFRDADFVVTDSFHGMVFSIINHTPFIVFANKKRGLARMESLLSLVGISSDRLVFEETADTFAVSALSPIDWDSVERTLDTLREQSGDWLINALKAQREK